MVRRRRGGGGFLPLDAGRHPHDPRLAALTGELSVESATFPHPVGPPSRPGQDARHQAAAPPRRGRSGTRLRNPPVAGDADQRPVTYTPAAGSASEERLRLLASWQASTAPPAGTHDRADQAR
ncbi:DNA-binding protein [Streptomyces sp. Ru62]|uniref:MmyB family transcriptional regulator n=1 Tax=Streptomyces sp. Ru62 TaxID=2080745 RepID=UPI0035BC8632